MQKLVHNGLLSVSDTGHVYKVMKDGRLKELTQRGISRGKRYLCVRPSINGKQATFYVNRLVDQVEEAHYGLNVPQLVNTVQKLAEVMAQILEREADK